ncbi:MAG: phosphatidylserine decarboxylase family protein [Lentimicrobiaceae bacterium]|jgi:phosphatidylserine decarboxylase|nr:phosphatidylserine decarboxylase family protein [Lentimicrobiaceae bacterium]
MHIHREGYNIIGIILLICVTIIATLNYFFPTQTWIHYLIYLNVAGWFIWTISFFRVPHRKINRFEGNVISSADGEVVVIEKVFEPEYFKDERIQVSIFMSPFNVHVNWYPVSGVVNYVKYHPGDFLFAKNPKASAKNERYSIVVKGNDEKEILVRQIAGWMARRIVCKRKVGDKAIQGEAFGMIRFGSRVDLFLPLDTDIKVKLHQKVKGQQTVIASL